MVRYIVASFALMGWGFYELSGGSDFEPAQWREISAPPVKTEQLAETAPTIANDFTAPEITRQIDRSTDAAPKVYLASVPTTHRLVGESVPTPVADMVILIPEPSAVAETKTSEPFNATVTRTSLTFEAHTDFRRVTGNRVNMRNGPGTQYSVVGKLVRDDEVEVLQDPGVGWVKLQVLETGQIAWMSAKLLTKPKT